MMTRNQFKHLKISIDLFGAETTNIEPDSILDNETLDMLYDEAERFNYSNEDLIDIIISQIYHEAENQLNVHIEF